MFLPADTEKDILVFSLPSYLLKSLHISEILPHLVDIFSQHLFKPKKFIHKIFFGGIFFDDFLLVRKRCLKCSFTSCF